MGFRRENCSPQPHDPELKSSKPWQIMQGTHILVVEAWRLTACSRSLDVQMTSGIDADLKIDLINYRMTNVVQIRTDSASMPGTGARSHKHTTEAEKHWWSSMHKRIREIVEINTRGVLYSLLEKSLQRKQTFLSRCARQYAGVKKN